MQQNLILEVLFVPRRAETMSLVRRAAESMDMNLHVCTDPEEVQTELFCHRFDGLIVEHDERTETFLRALRQSPSSRGAIAIDLHGQEVSLQQVFAMGANFEILQPLSFDRVKRTLNLAFGLMMLGRRRYFRHPVQVPVQVTVENQVYDGLICNVSETGVGLRISSGVLKPGNIKCTFDVPESAETIRMEGLVIWGDQSGQAGCRINQIVQGQGAYMEWIYRLFQKSLAAMPTLTTEYRSRGLQASQQPLRVQ